MSWISGQKTDLKVPSQDFCVSSGFPLCVPKQKDSRSGLYRSLSGFSTSKLFSLDYPQKKKSHKLCMFRGPCAVSDGDRKGEDTINSAFTVTKNIQEASTKGSFSADRTHNSVKTRVSTPVTCNPQLNDLGSKFSSYLQGIVSEKRKKEEQGSRVTPNSHINADRLFISSTSRSTASGMNTSLISSIGYDSSTFSTPNAKFYLKKM